MDVRIAEAIPSDKSDKQKGASEKGHWKNVSSIDRLENLKIKGDFKKIEALEMLVPKKKWHLKDVPTKRVYSPKKDYYYYHSSLKKLGFCMAEMKMDARI